MSYDHVLASYADGKLHDYLNSLEPDCGECLDHHRRCLFCTEVPDGCKCKFDPKNATHWAWAEKIMLDPESYTPEEFREEAVENFKDLRWVTCPVCNGGER